MSAKMQDFKPIEVKLKNDKLVTIRSAELSDAKEFLKAIETYIPQSEFIPKLKKEINRTVRQQEEWIDSFIASKNSLLLVAEHGNDIIGNLDLTGNKRKIMEHTAMLGMGMLKEWRNMGLGTELISTAVEWAKNNPILELIWLEVYTDNMLGLGLYEKMGFQKNGIVKKFFKHKNKYSHKMTMSLSL